MKLGVYQHYKGGRYEVVCIAKHSETLEDMVVYRALYDNDVSAWWVRPLSLFEDSVEVAGVLTSRFHYIET